MNETLYHTLCWGIRLSPAVFMGIAWVVLHYRRQEKMQLPMTLAIGYLTGVFAVWLYWDFAAQYAPTEAIADEIISKDGAPRFLAPFVMPFFVGIYFLLMWPFTKLITMVFPLREAQI